MEYLGIHFAFYPACMQGAIKTSLGFVLAWLLIVVCAVAEESLPKDELERVIPLDTLFVGHRCESIDIARLSEVSWGILAGNEPSTEDLDWADQCDVNWHILGGFHDLRSFSEWASEHRRFVVEHNIRPYYHNQSSSYWLPFKEVSTWSRDEVDTNLGDHTHSLLIDLYKREQISRVRMIFAHESAGISVYQPGQSFTSLYSGYLRNQNLDMTEGRVRNTVHINQELLSALGVIEEDRFRQPEEIFIDWGLLDSEGQFGLMPNGRAHKKIAAQLEEAVRGCGHPTLGRSDRFMSRLFGGFTVEGVYRKGVCHITVTRATGEKETLEIKPGFSPTESLVLKFAAYPLSVWIVGGFTALPIAISLLTIGTVGAEINTHGVGAYVGPPLCRWGHVGFGPSVGYRYGFKKPLLANMPIVPGQDQALLPGHNINAHFGVTAWRLHETLYDFPYLGVMMPHANLFCNYNFQSQSTMGGFGFVSGRGGAHYSVDVLSKDRSWYGGWGPLLWAGRIDADEGDGESEFFFMPGFRGSFVRPRSLALSPTSSMLSSRTARPNGLHIGPNFAFPSKRFFSDVAKHGFKRTVISRLPLPTRDKLEVNTILIDGIKYVRLYRGVGKGSLEKLQSGVRSLNEGPTIFTLSPRSAREFARTWHKGELFLVELLIPIRRLDTYVGTFGNSVIAYYGTMGVDPAWITTVAPIPRKMEGPE